MKTVASYALLFSENDVELAQEIDEEDTNDEEDTEKETSEKDMYINEFDIKTPELIDISSISHSKFVHYDNWYISPTMGDFYSPPEFS